MCGLKYSGIFETTHPPLPPARVSQIETRILDYQGGRCFEVRQYIEFLQARPSHSAPFSDPPCPLIALSCALRTTNDA